ncbi:MAG TPA: hypothetical protein VIT23_17320, partial [Terrimicrobiaceae bacterium]
VYDSNTNSLAVGINFFGIAGDADGNGDPSNTSGALSSSGGTDQPNLSGGEAIQIAFDWNADSTFDIIAGIPLFQSAANFSVAPFVNPQPLPADNTHFGPALVGLSPFAGAVNASAPDFEFLIPNVSSLAGFNPAGFSFQAFAGSNIDDGIGEDILSGTVQLPAVASVPENSSAIALLGLALLAIGIFRRVTVAI